MKLRQMIDGRIARTAILANDSARVFVLRVYHNHAEWYELRDGEHSCGIKEVWATNSEFDLAMQRLESRAREKWVGLTIKRID